MKLIVKANALSKVLVEAYNAIPAKSTEPSFLNFLLTVTEDGLQILASDGDITLKTFLPKKEGDTVNITELEPGSCQVAAKMISEVIRKLGNSLVTLALTDSTVLSVSADNTYYSLKTTLAADYPDIDIDFDPASALTIPYPDFAKLYQCTAFAVAVKNARLNFTGLNIRTQDGKLYFLATDGCRLAQRSVDLKTQSSFNVTVPVKVLGMIAKKDGAKEVLMECPKDGGKAIFKVGNTLYQTRLYSGEFPNPDRLRPSATPYVLTVNSSDLLEALDRVALVNTDDPIAIARLTCSQDDCEVIATSSTSGSAKEKLEKFTFEGKLFDINFNSRFVSDAVRALGSPKVTLAFAGEGKLFLVQNEDEANFQVITPTRGAE